MSTYDEEENKQQTKKIDNKNLTCFEFDLFRLMRINLALLKIQGLFLHYTRERNDLTDADDVTSKGKKKRKLSKFHFIYCMLLYLFKVWGAPAYPIYEATVTLLNVTSVSSSLNLTRSESVDLYFCLYVEYIANQMMNIQLLIYPLLILYLSSFDHKRSIRRLGANFRNVQSKLMNLWEN